MSDTSVSTAAPTVSKPALIHSVSTVIASEIQEEKLQLNKDIQTVLLRLQELDKVEATAERQSSKQANDV